MINQARIDGQANQHIRPVATLPPKGMKSLEESISRTIELEQLLEFGQAVFSTLDLDDVLHIVARRLVDSLKVTFSYVSLLNENSNLLVVRANARASARPGLLDSIPSEFSPGQAPSFKEVLLTAKPLLIRQDFLSGMSDPEEMQVVFDRSTKTELLVPMEAKGRLLGIVVLGEHREWKRAPFTVEKIRFCSAMVRQAAIAIENARQFSLKFDFLSMISHELRTNLAGINASAELLGKGVNDPRSRQLPELMLAQTQRLRSFVEDILNVSQIDAGALDLHLAAVPLIPLLKRAIATAQATTKHHFFELRVEGKVPLVMADANRVEIVINNLIRNAINYSPKGGRVTIELRAESGNMVVVAVEDEGIGIPADKRKCIFDRFVRANNGTAAVRGHGLGLYIARNLVERHGGRIWVESEEGRGSRISFSLPVFRMEETTGARGIQ
ncbi:MAG: ATP-binding protein [Chloroflexota bacterium]|jgi:signal transduction histidine kinase